MKIADAIAEVDEYCSNRVEISQKLRWINRVERRIIEEAISRYPELMSLAEGFNGYIDSDIGKVSVELIVIEPYAELYIHYIAAQIHLMHYEQKHYNNEIEIFNSLLADYKIYLNRKYRPGGRKKFRAR